MRKGMALAVALLSIFVFGSTAQALNVAYFNDSTFVDIDQEGAFLDSALVSLGHTVIRFDGTDATSWGDALATADVLVIPEIAFGDLGALPTATEGVAREFVRGGGGLVANYTVGNIFNFLLDVYGLPLPVIVSSAVATSKSTTGVTGTVMVDAPPALSTPSDVNLLTNGTIPPGARNLYTSGGNCAAYATSFGSGRIVWTGYDWFEASLPPDWVAFLGLALEHVGNVPNLGQSIALYYDGAHVDTSDTGEATKMRDLINAMGHTVTTFTGVTTAEWAAALAGADAVVIPEIEGAALLPALEAGAQDAVAEFVAQGGTFQANYTGGNMIGLVNALFGFSITTTGGTTTSRAFSPSFNSLFQEGPQSLSAPSATGGVTTGSLPAGAQTLYVSATTATVVSVNFGAGRVYWFGYDFFTSGTAPIPFDWQNVLGLAFLERPARGVFPTTAVARGGDATLTIGISDETSAVAGDVFWRRGGAAAFTSTAMSDNGDGTFSATIPAGDLTDTGVQYYVELTDGLGTSTQPGGPDAGTFASLPVQVTSFPFASLQPEAFELRGVPVQPADPSPEAAFGLGAYNRSQWRYGVFNPVAGGYQEPDTGAPPANPGQGFWIVARNGTNVTLSGQSSDVSGTLTQTLRPGFNQVANPFAFPIDADDVPLPSSVEFNFIAFANGGYVNNNTILLPGTGYWLNNTGGGDVTVRFPALGSGVASVPGFRTEPRPFPGQLPADEDGWSVHVASTVGSAFDRDQRFGMRAGATDEKDAFDFSDAPAPPADYVAVSLLTRDGHALLTDWRADGTEGATWDLLLRSDRIGETWNLTFDVERDLPADWSLVAIDGGGAEVVDLLATPALSGEVTSEAFQRNWTIVAGGPEYVDSVRDQLGSAIQSFAFGAPRPNPLRGVRSATMDFQVPRRTEASVEVYDLQGRRVKTLLSGPVERGQHRVIWDGTNTGGAPVAAGVYFVKARAADFSETRKVTYLR